MYESASMTARASQSKASASAPYQSTLVMSAEYSYSRKELCLREMLIKYVRLTLNFHRKAVDGVPVIVWRARMKCPQPPAR
ncbi:MAG: hypothetical protein GKR94_20080 [Gammaproteobacteria bacterium]|nr:hypothetical protein [Gammaproteobacteria bacterium]